MGIIFKIIVIGIISIVLAGIAFKILMGLLSSIMPIVIIVGGIWLAMKMFSNNKSKSTKQTF